MTVKDYYETIRDIERLAALVDVDCHAPMPPCRLRGHGTDAGGN